MKAASLESCLEADADLNHSRASAHPWWLYLNLFSLDAPLVAVVWLAAFSRAFHSTVAFAVYAVLFLAVWSIYIADRLIDGFRQQQWELATTRHCFVRGHFKFFLGLLAINLSLAAGLALSRLPFDLLVAGLILCLAVAFYFGAFVRLLPQWKPLCAKEFACGLVFAIGTVLGVDAVRQGVFIQPGRVIPVVILFAGLCVYNCLIIAAREHSSDQVNDPSAASTWWTHLDRDLIFFGMLLVSISGVGWVLGSLPGLYAAIFASAIALTLIHFFQHRLSPALSRVLVDAVLLSPLLFGGL